MCTLLTRTVNNDIASSRQLIMLAEVYFPSTMHYEYLNTGCDLCQVVFSMFNKLLICLCLADLLFLVSNLAISPIYVAQVNNILHSCSR